MKLWINRKQIVLNTLLRQLLDRFKHRKKALSFLGIILSTFGLVLISESGLRFSTPSDWVPGFPVNLQYGQVEWEIGQSRQEGTKSTMMWTDGDQIGATPQVIRTVDEYSSSLESWFSYIRAAWGIRLSNKWPNFYDPQYRYLKNDQKFRLLEENFITCEMGGEDYCQRWQYIGRYGRFKLEVVYMAPSEGIGTDSFLQILKGVVNDLKREDIGYSYTKGFNSRPKAQPGYYFDGLNASDLCRKFLGGQGMPSLKPELIEGKYITDPVELFKLKGLTPFFDELNKVFSVEGNWILGSYTTSGREVYAEGDPKVNNTIMLLIDESIWSNLLYKSKLEVLTQSMYKLKKHISSEESLELFVFTCNTGKWVGYADMSDTSRQVLFDWE